ncbi:TraR/DksA family transcriptional regulator [Arhodomonas sp. SL1]|uniref:TraR/DksA family transcriptional regulator n=1 Tax=Arhodomonas sp. SL1 TaxID=3425691 RepID=UPI003F880F90
MSEDRMARLREMESDALERIEKYEQHLRRAAGPLDRDIEDQAIELENDEVVEGLLESTRKQLRQIRHAMARVQDGNGEVCEVCDGPISAERIEALPATTICSECAEEQG